MNNYEPNYNNSMYDYVVKYLPTNYEECREIYLLMKKYYPVVILIIGFLLTTFCKKIFGRNGSKYLINIVAIAVVFGLFWRYTSYSDEK